MYEGFSKLCFRIINIVSGGKKNFSTLDCSTVGQTVNYDSKSVKLYSYTLKQLV